jgi:hypothetical protein
LVIGRETISITRAKSPDIDAFSDGGGSVVSSPRFGGGPRASPSGFSIKFVSPRDRDQSKAFRGECRPSDISGFTSDPESFCLEAFE